MGHNGHPPEEPRPHTPFTSWTLTNDDLGCTPPVTGANRDQVAHSVDARFRT